MDASPNPSPTGKDTLHGDLETCRNVLLECAGRSELSYIAYADLTGHWTPCRIGTRCCEPLVELFIGQTSHSVQLCMAVLQTWLEREMNLIGCNATFFYGLRTSQSNRGVMHWVWAPLPVASHLLALHGTAWFSSEFFLVAKSLSAKKALELVLDCLPRTPLTHPRKLLAVEHAKSRHQPALTSS